MRKISMILFVLCTVAYSCSNDENDLLINETIANSPSNLRTIEDAIDIAKKAKALAVPVQTRSTTNKVEIDDVVCINSLQTRAGVSLDTLLYIVNFKNENGFAVISANPNTKEDLLALIDNGHFDEATNMSEGFKQFMDNAKQYVSSATLTRATNAREVQRIETDTMVSRRTPKLSVEWGQTGCEGFYAPNGYAGCSNIAMAQIMSYYQYPQAMFITYDGGVSLLTLNWPEIIQTTSEHTHSSVCNQQLAKLVRQLGYLNNSNYSSPLGTSTQTASVRNTFSQTFLYNVSSIKNYAKEDFSTALSNDKLIYMRGEATDSRGDTVGHGWVVDGNLVLDITTTEWSQLFGEEEWHLIYEGTERRKYIHINWGWYGYNNGYFSTELLATGYGYSYDSSNHSSYENLLFNSNLYYFEVKH